MKSVFITIGLIILAFFIGSKYAFFDFNKARQSASSGTSVPTNGQTAGVVQPAYAAGTKEQFDFLSQQTSSSCGLQPTNVDGYSDDQRIQGACCSAMDFHRYQEQVEGLRQYSQIPQIPPDPYDVPASLAKELFNYQQTLQLTKEQQTVYDRATEISNEGGPCCCKCWRWYAFEGLAKFLITEKNWGAEQIAELWDLLDGCGGAGHEH